MSQIATSAMSDTSAYSLPLPKLPPLLLGKFNANNFYDWMHTAQRFFVQYKLWDIVIGDSVNPAGDVEPSVVSGKIDLGETAGPIGTAGRFLQGNPDPAKPHEVNVYRWNERHSLAYNYLLDSVAPDPAAYSRIVSCKTAADGWTKLVTQYGTRSDAKLSVLEDKLFFLKKTPAVSMSIHVDNYTRLVQQIQFHNPPAKRWEPDTINRRFLGTLDKKEWGPWILALGPRVDIMTPEQLYATIQLDDEIMYGEAETTKPEVSLASRIDDLETRISDSKSGQRGKRGNKRGKGNRDRTKSKPLHRAPQSFDGFVYDGRRPSEEYV